MKKMFIRFAVIAVCLFSLSSCITMTLLNLSTHSKDTLYDDRGCSKSVFTVALGKTIRFSRANIYGHYSDPSKYSKKYGEEKYGTGWYFASNCFECRGGRPSEEYNYGECDNVRFNHGGKVVEGYRLLTAEEWDYLLFKRKASTINGVADARFVICEVDYKKGLIVFPDQYTHPKGVPEIFCANDKCGISKDNSFKDLEWEKMEKAGAVFIIEPCTMYSTCPQGYLTSSKNNNGEVGFMCFPNIVFKQLGIRWYSERSKGLARLVVDN